MTFVFDQQSLKSFLKESQDRLVDILQLNQGKRIQDMFIKHKYTIDHFGGVDGWKCKFAPERFLRQSLTRSRRDMRNYHVLTRETPRQPSYQSKPYSRVVMLFLQYYFIPFNCSRGFYTLSVISICRIEYHQKFSAKYIVDLCRFRGF